MVQVKEKWASRVGLVLAMAGNAVGLGNFLRFPAQAAQNGGGAFIIPYLVSFLLMGIPLLWVEWAIGRHGGQFGYHSTPGLVQSLGKQRIWKYAGVFGIFTNLAIVAYYTYIESWTLSYVYYSITGAFSHKTPVEISSFFSQYLNLNSGSFFSTSGPSFLFFLVTLGLNLWILSHGLSGGIERANKIGMPLLILFAVFLVIRTLTLKAGNYGAVHDASAGLNFLWQPRFNSLSDPKIWLAAAGQIFFTLSVGMGSILVYASYVRKNDDIALNASSAGWMNEFVEVVLGGSVVLPIAVAYLGLDWVKANVGFEMGFRTMPTLFQNWGPILAALAGMAWFGLLFFAGITSSLAMGQPVMTFFQDTYGMDRKKSVAVFGIITFLMALPCVFLYGKGAFGEFDYWAGTFSLVMFALIEIIAFAWVFGMDRGWKEITRGADIEVPRVFKFIIKYITTAFLLAIFFAALFKPMNSDWGSAFSGLLHGKGWPLESDSVLGSVLNVGEEKLFACTDKGLYFSHDQGNHWYESNKKLESTDIRTLMVKGTDLFIGTGDGVFLSKDKGAEWSAVNKGLTEPDICTLAYMDTSLFAGGKNGVFISTDNGANWHGVNDGMTQMDVYVLTVLGTNLYAGTQQGIFRSKDRGTRWKRVGENLKSAGVESFAVIEKNIFAGTNLGVFLSSDSGQTWNEASNGLVNKRIGILAVSGTVLFASIRGGGIFQSNDNGSTWQIVNERFKEEDLRTLAADASSVYAGIYRQGIFRSRDKGKSWQQINHGLTNPNINYVTLKKRLWFNNGQPTNLFVKNMTRIFLLVIFIGIAVLVHVGWRRKSKKMTGESS